MPALCSKLRVAAIAAGAGHSLFVTETGALLTCGMGDYGQLGHGDRNARASPREVEALRGVKLAGVAAGAHHSIALAAGAGGAVYAWGYGQSGQLGHGRPGNELAPRELKGFLKELRETAEPDDGATRAADATDGGGRCLLYTSPSPRDGLLSRMPSSA